MDPVEAQWTEEQGRRFELAKEILSDEIGRRNDRLETCPEEERPAVRTERKSLVHLKGMLRIEDDRRIDLILDRDVMAALEDDAPQMRVG